LKTPSIASTNTIIIQNLFQLANTYFYGILSPHFCFIATVVSTLLLVELPLDLGPSDAKG
jgi:hypothetical protein